jgi:hypothetical protein
MPVRTRAEEKTARAEAAGEEREHRRRCSGRSTEHQAKLPTPRDLVRERARSGTEEQRPELGRDRAAHETVGCFGRIFQFHVARDRTSVLGTRQ